MAASNTGLAGAAGAISAMLTYMWKKSQLADGDYQFDLTKTMNGCLTGLVSITAGCGIVEPWAAVVIGTVAGWIYLWGSYALVQNKLDDAVDGIPVHLGGGVWGLFAVGFLASPSLMEQAYGHSNHSGLFYTLTHGGVDGTLLAAQVLAILFIFFWAAALMLPFFYIMNHLNWFRADTLEEIAGLDARYNHAQQEDHEEVRKKIVKEYRKHQKREGELSSVASHSRDGMSLSKGGASRTSQGKRSAPTRGNTASIGASSFDEGSMLSA